MDRPGGHRRGGIARAGNTRGRVGGGCGSVATRHDGKKPGASPVVLSGGGAGPRLPVEAEGETGWQRSVTVLEDYIDLRWTPGNLKKVFIASVAGATGGMGSAEVSFAAKALVTTGDSAGFLRFVSNLGTGGFGRVDEIVRADFPGHVPWP